MVEEYANALATDADNYAILRVESRLRDFPQLIQSLETPTTSAATVSPTPLIRS
jgi:hypothetical protein